MPFTVKATYGRSGELRKLTFASFPSYEQLYNQLYRVFPISHSYFLSKLLFSPDSSQSTILISKEVHNAEQYNSCTAPYCNGLWTNAMLRFTVFDETPHKLPAGFVADNASASTLTGGSAPSPFISISAIPPPPIILSSASGSSATMDVDSSAKAYSPCSMSTPTPQHQHDPQSGTACCAVSQGKVEMEGIVSKFKQDLDRILQSSFSTPVTTPAQTLTPMPTSNYCLYKYCNTCARIFQGPWYACGTCSTVRCPGCFEKQGNDFCSAVNAPHTLKKEVCAACPAVDPPANTPWGRPLPMPFISQWTPPQQGYNPIYPFMQPQPFIPANELPRAPAPVAAAALPPLPVPSVAQVPGAAPPPAPPVIHRGVVCDMCDNVVEGIRHKCLDCPDYDLCTPCIQSGSAERHNPFHEFLEIKEPGRVIVHTVYSGDGERDASPTTSTRAPAPSQAEAEAEAEAQPAVHYATCNLCDSRIRGDRYKCADCPDFDTCSNCFSITREQHPHHAFVKLTNASDYIRRENCCTKTVYGIRYKCMHPECPDFDLCESCEAFPIPVHPDNHPLLKMRSPSTVVPTVYRVGQTTLIDAERGRSPAPAPRARSRSASFGRGYMMNPNDRRNTMPASFFDSAPSPIPPPSPFFFRSESSRSSSPVLAYQPPLSPYVPRPPSPTPMTMPGGLYDEPAFARQPQPQPPYNWLFTRPQPTASRFSHSPSPSPSPPLFRNRSRSPTPPRLSRHAVWGTHAMPETTSQWPSFEGPSLRQLVEQQRQQLQQQLEQHQQREREEHEAREQIIAHDLALADSMAQERRQAMEQLVEAHKMLEQHVEQSQMRWAVPAIPPIPTPAAEPAFPSFWPKSSEDLRHLMTHDEPAIDAFSRLSVQEEPAVMDSPLTGEALLNRPVEMAQANKAPMSFNHSLAALLNGYDSDNEVEKETQEPLIALAEETPAPAPARATVSVPAAPSLAPAAVPVPIPVPAPALGLRATFVNDLTLPDGQIFPPGAEFMKCWQMVNSGGLDWPSATELVFVAGERLAREPGGPANVAIGSCKVGAQVELRPETPGRYGQLFGDSIWIDINVTETRSNSNESSLSSSSIIVMPRGAQSVPTFVRGRASRVAPVPTSEDEDWAQAQAQRYVVLYDDASSHSSQSESDSE
ncbi:hypothetical protein DFH06DRAFT_1207790 [Mycena polygramma]|nr:hypothetical protein DFH06DRAFT_1207790 [Mycena polygramma]